MPEVIRVLPDGARISAEGLIGPTSANRAQFDYPHVAPIEVFEADETPQGLRTVNVLEPEPQVVFESQSQEVASRNILEGIKSNLSLIKTAVSERVHFPKKLRRFAAGPLLAATVALSNAACVNPNAVSPTQSPERTPIVLATSKPDATQLTLPPTEVKTPEPTVAPTPEPTPIPEPTEAPKPENLASLLELQPTKIDRTKVKDTLVAAWNRIQKLQAEEKVDPILPKYTLDQFMTKWDTCTKATDPGNRQIACAGHINYMSRVKDPSNPVNIDPAVYPAVKVFLFDAETTLPEPNLSQMIKDLRDLSKQI